MANNETGSAYGYASDAGNPNPFKFGLNAGSCFLTKFEWIPNGGKEGKEQEALDIIFRINGVDRSYRQFPVVKAFTKDGGEVTDQESPEVKDAVIDFNRRMTHLLHGFRENEEIKAIFSRRIRDFKEYCQIAQGALPRDFIQMPLDIFMQYQWEIREGSTRTFLEIPKKMKYGPFICAAQQGNWKEMRLPNPTDNDRKALWYVDENSATRDGSGNITGYEREHPFTKNGWFMNSNFAKQRFTSEDEESKKKTNGSTTPASVPANTEGVQPAAW